jgi:hypothetical protein
VKLLLPTMKSTLLLGSAADHGRCFSFAALSIPSKQQQQPTRAACNHAQVSACNSAYSFSVNCTAILCSFHELLSLFESQKEEVV